MKILSIISDDSRGSHAKYIVSEREQVIRLHLFCLALVFPIKVRAGSDKFAYEYPCRSIN